MEGLLSTGPTPSSLCGFLTKMAKTSGNAYLANILRTKEYISFRLVGGQLSPLREGCRKGPKTISYIFYKLQIYEKTTGKNVVFNVR